MTRQLFRNAEIGWNVRLMLICPILSAGSATARKSRGTKPPNFPRLEIRRLKRLAGLAKIGNGLAGFATLSFAKSLLDTADAMQSINSQVRQVTSSGNGVFSHYSVSFGRGQNSTSASLESTASLSIFDKPRLERLRLRNRKY